MNEVTSSATTTTTTTDHRPFKPKSILRNSKSSPSLRKKSSSGVSRSKTNLSTSITASKSSTQLHHRSFGAAKSSTTSATAQSSQPSTASAPANKKSSKKNAAASSTAAAASSSASSSKSKLSSIFHRFTANCSSLLYKIRTISEEVFSNDELTKEFFVSSESDSFDGLATFDRVARANKGYASAEERFLEEFAATKSLEKMYQQRRQQQQHDPQHQYPQHHDSSVPPPVPPKPSHMTESHRISLQEVVRQAASQWVPPSNDGSRYSSTTNLEVSYQTLDVCEMRKDLESGVLAASFQTSPSLGATSASPSGGSGTSPVPVPSPSGAATSASAATDSNVSTSSSSTPPSSSSSHAASASTGNTSVATASTEMNIGEALWNYRRTKWLQTDKTFHELEARRNTNYLSDLPPESQVKIYASLVNKGKVLKKDKRLNLQDLVQVINQGWIAEEKWERAGKGLP